MAKTVRLALVIAIVMAVFAIIAIISALSYSPPSSAHFQRNTLIRTYYIAAVEEDWNYIPEETDLFKQRNSYDVPVSEETDTDPFYISRVNKRALEDINPSGLNHVYKKAVFREFTDDTYTQQKEQPPWMGILGPIIKANVGEEIEIYFYNNASHPVSLHAHGVQYEKEHEGAFYHNHSVEQMDDKVLPGKSFKYIWKVPPQRGPTESDSDCVVWAYHSHVSGDTDIHTGLIGPLMVCKSGIQNVSSFDTESSGFFILLFLIFDENQSWYFNENLYSKTANVSQQERNNIAEEEEFQKSNHMYSINGYMYDNVPGLEMCAGSEWKWYFIGMGNEADIHSVTFSGHSLIVNGHRTDVIHLFPAKFSMAVMNGSYEGKWSIKSEVGDHFQAGMEASFSVKHCVNYSFSAPKLNSIERKYYIAIEEILWDYAPSGINKISGLPILNDSESAVFFEKQSNRIGGIYKKAMYRAYEDSEFKYPAIHSQDLGILGPTIRAEVGDILEVHLFNNASKPFSFHSTAFVCLTCNNTVTGENLVKPGENQTYIWFISENLGPSAQDPQCISWRYFSDGDSLSSSYAGLNGLLLTCHPGTLTTDGLQKNIDKEFVLMFAVMDENNSPYLNENIHSFAFDPKLIDKKDENFVESNLMHSINGLMYGNLLGLDICMYEKISWHMFAFGHEVDMHVAHFQGNNFLYNGLYRNTLELLPGSHSSVTMMPDSEGKWMLECRTNDHVKGGMQTWYEVRTCGHNKSNFVMTSDNQVREYFIAAVEEEWDYAPTNYHIITGQNLTENEESKIFVTQDTKHIGSRYKKILFREFSNSDFSDVKVRSPESEHLGILGPLIKAEVGDIIKIVFKNQASRDCNINLHGLMEDRNNTQPVKPGEGKTYTWNVPKRSGPSTGGFNCTSWIYYSTVDSIKDMNSGLVGPLVICNPGILTETGSRIDVQKEFSVLFTVFDENESWLLDQNIQEYCWDPASVDPENDGFKESNKKHSMNGRLYGTLEGLDGTVGETVAWYLMGLGTEIDLHTAHFHGLIFSENDDLTSGANIRRGDVVDLFPGIYHTVEMTLDTPGSWLFHCHVDDHLKAGMFALLNVKEK